MKQSVLSRVLVAGVVIGATAGWVGAQTNPTDTVQAAPAAVVKPATSLSPSSDAPVPGVRNRASWQPSPIPSQSSQSSPTSGQVADSEPVTVPVVSAPVAPAPVASAPVASAPVAPPTSDVLTGPGAAALSVVPGPASAQISPLTKVESWLKGFWKTEPAGSVSDGSEGVALTSIAPSVAPASVVSFNDVLSRDRLEELDPALPTQRGEWRYITFFSRSLGREETYYAWLPPGYSTSGRDYPTLYLLHGVGGGAGFGPDEWIGYTLTEDLDRMLALGLIEPMIVVLPNGEQGYWMNHADGGPRWADFVANDLVQHVDATFRTIQARERRAIGGLSMGAHGALQIAYNHPEEFAVAGAHSPTIRSFEDSPDFFGDQQWFAHYDPLTLASTTSAPLRIATWIDVGEDDRWRAGAEALDNVLVAKQAPVEFHVLEGEHEGWYWQYYLPEYLNFYSQALSTAAKTPQGAPKVTTHLIGPNIDVPASLTTAIAGIPAHS